MRLISFVVVLFVACEITFAQPVFNISGGYSHLSATNKNNLLLDKDGGYIDGDAGFRIYGGFPLVLGGGIGFSGYFDSRDVLIPVGGGTFLGSTDYSDFALVNFEARAAIPIMFGTDRGFFVEPRIGAGLLWENYSIDTENAANTEFFTEQHDGLGVEVRPSVQVGYSWGPGAAGVETSYMASWGDFGAFGSRLQELRVGGFFSWRF